MSDKNTLKSYFETGDTPTQAEFADLIDSLGLQSEVDINTAKVGITTAQANAIVTHENDIADLQTDVGNNTGNIQTNTTKLAGIEAGAEVNTINSITTGEISGSDQVLNVVSLTQAEYDAGTPITTTLYIITDA